MIRKHMFYIVYNIAYQLVSFFCLLFANTYLNDRVVPERLMWKGDGRRMDKAGLSGYATIKALTLIGEAAVLILLIYIINRLVLTDTEGKEGRVFIANRTATINIILSFCFIAVLIWGSFRGLIW